MDEIKPQEALVAVEENEAVPVRMTPEEFLNTVPPVKRGMVIEICFRVALGQVKAHIAREMSISLRTIYRWLNMPGCLSYVESINFRESSAQYLDALAELQARAAMRKAKFMLDGNLITLKELRRKAASESVKLGAVKEIREMSGAGELKKIEVKHVHELKKGTQDYIQSVISEIARREEKHGA